MKIDLLPLEQRLYQLFEDQNQKIGHVRADHDGNRWWTGWWPKNELLKTTDRKKEIELVCGYLLEERLKNGLPDIEALCTEHPETKVGEPHEGEYNFFVDGTECVYWVRLITRPRDYNFYLHCFIKPSENGGESVEH